MKSPLVIAVTVVSLLLVSACSSVADSAPTDVPAAASNQVLTTEAPTPIDLDLSKGPLPAGVPLVKDDFSLVVHEDFSVDDVSNIHYSLVIQNIGTRTRLLSFNCSAFGMRDDLGNEYETYQADDEELYRERQFDLKPGEVQKLEGSNGWTWAGRFRIPSFVGPISPQASQIILQLDGLGPFSGVEIAIDL